MGRRTKLLNNTIKDIILKYISNGNYIKTACMAAGVSERTFYNWEHRASDYNPDVRTPFKQDGNYIYFRFFQDLKKAEAENITHNIQNIQDAGDNDKRNWMASAWLMERKYPAEFGKRIELEVGPSKVLLALQEQAQQLVTKDTKLLTSENDRSANPQDDT